MFMRRTMVGFATILACLLTVFTPADSGAFMKDGCGGGACSDCHSLTREEAGNILRGVFDNVLSVSESPVAGLWLLEVEKGGRRGPIYLDFSKDFVISGQIFQISSMANITGSRTAALARVDPSTIPLAGALVVGKSTAKEKVIVFSDPDCHFCAKLHPELKRVAANDPNVAFYIKLYSRNGNPASTRKAISVVCSQSEALLEDAYAGKEISPAPASCKDTIVRETAETAERLTLRGTPTLILPDGRIVRGYRDAATLRALLKEKPAASGPGPGHGKESP
jgi:thiol:disulfide interchange protein DsbC